jgi:hypothetical protein
MHVTAASPFHHMIKLGVRRQAHVMEISHKAPRIFDSGRDYCYPRIGSSCAKKSDCENGTRLRKPTRLRRCREMKHFKNVGTATGRRHLQAVTSLPVARQIGIKPQVMSAIGPKRTWANAPHMSAFDPKRTLPRLANLI